MTKHEALTIRVEGLSVALPGMINETEIYDVIDQLSIAIDQGKTFALVGESGSGKSMTALSLLRLLPEGLRIRSGKVLLDGLDLFALREMDMLRIRGRRVAMIFQEPATSLNPVMTVGRQLLEVIEKQGIAKGAPARAIALDWFSRVGLTNASQRMNAYPFELSGGQKQRVMIAMALAAEPDLLIADEPTTALDVSLQAQIMALLKALQQERGMAMLLITHDLALVSDVADHIALMYAGQIVESRSSKDFFASPRHPYGRLLLKAVPKASDRGKTLAAIEGTVPTLRQRFAGCRFESRCPWVIKDCSELVPAFEAKFGVRCLRGGEMLEFSPSATKPDDHLVHNAAERTLRRSSSSIDTGLHHLPMALHDSERKRLKLLEVQDLRVRYRRSGRWFEAVSGVDMTLHRGETLALVGESGCGKTTIGKALMGLLPEDATVEGQAIFTEDGLPLIPRGLGNRLKIQTRMQMIFQDPFASLNPRMRIQQVLEEGMRSLRRELSTQQGFDVIKSLLEQVGLGAEVLNRYPHEFSGGQRQRIAIARALAVEPRVLICDEPTSALDVSVQAQILNLLVRLRDSLGLSLVFITHNIGVVEFLADRIAVMKDGKILEQGESNDVLGYPTHPYTRDLLRSVPRLRV